MKSELLIVLLGLLAGASSQSQVCLLPPDTGTCRAFLPSFYFNSQTGVCDCFVFGGCQPGGNNFVTMNECIRVCNVSPDRQIMTPDCQRILADRNPPPPQQPGVTQPQPHPQPQPQPQPQPLPLPLPHPQPQPLPQPQRPQQPEGPQKENLTPDQVQQLETIFNEATSQQNVPNQPQKPQTPQVQPGEPTRAAPSQPTPQPIRPRPFRPRESNEEEDDDKEKFVRVRPGHSVTGTVFGSSGRQGVTQIAVGQPVRITG